LASSDRLSGSKLTKNMINMRKFEQTIDSMLSQIL